MNNTKQSIQLLSDKQQEIYSKICIVRKTVQYVLTIDVEPIDSYNYNKDVQNYDNTIYNVQLAPRITVFGSAGTYKRPKVDSLVIVSFLDRENAFAHLFSELEQFTLKQSDITWNFGRNGKSKIINPNIFKVNETIIIEDRILKQSIINCSHIHIENLTNSYIDLNSPSPTNDLIIPCNDNERIFIGRQLNTIQTNLYTEKLSYFRKKWGLYYLSVYLQGLNLYINKPFYNPLLIRWLWEQLAFHLYGDKNRYEDARDNFYSVSEVSVLQGDLVWKKPIEHTGEDPHAYLVEFISYATGIPYPEESINTNGLEFIYDDLETSMSWSEMLDLIEYREKTEVGINQSRIINQTPLVNKKITDYKLDLGYELEFLKLITNTSDLYDQALYILDNENLNITDIPKNKQDSANSNYFTYMNGTGVYDSNSVIGFLMFNGFDPISNVVELWEEYNMTSYYLPYYNPFSVSYDSFFNNTILNGTNIIDYFTNFREYLERLYNSAYGFQQIKITETDEYGDSLKKILDDFITILQGSVLTWTSANPSPPPPNFIHISIPSTSMTQNMVDINTNTNKILK